MDGVMRRREMVQTGGTEDYVRDGLIFFLDGLNRGGVTGQWKDIIGNNIFTLTSACVEEDNCVNFSASGAYGTHSGVITTTSYTYNTIECAFSGWTSSAFLFSQPYSNSTKRISLVTGGRSTYINCAIVADGTQRPRWNALYDTKLLSLSNTTGVANLTEISQGSNDSWYYLSGSTVYLAIRNGSASKYSGKIYGLRIYNRQLTADEMKQNQRVDMRRYGITI